MTAAGLALDQVTLRLGGRVVLDDLSLDVRPGELLALVGPNGSGKTTALRMLTGALMPDVGRALIDGRSVAGLGRRAVAGRIAHLPQGFRSHWNLTVRDLVRLGAARGAGWWQAGRPAAPDPALDLGDLLDRRLDDLSGGERARAAVAWALAAPAGALLADEPAAALDIGHALSLMQLFESLRGSMTVVVVLHDLGLALAHADRVAVLAKGRLLALDPPAAVLRNGAIEAAFGIRPVPAPITPGAWPVAVRARPEPRGNPGDSL
ncbi:ABC transporter ATP-binding protein [Tistrella mobilis]|uniref:ABC transporter ATP-binding protein n=1 Tax=Tistrella mobilis TaxID=171437 RepID=UPI003558E3C4